jgi:hypothetical protein
MTVSRKLSEWKKLELVMYGIYELVIWRTDSCVEVML